VLSLLLLIIQGVWRNLLACRRGDLMPAVPLAGERLAQMHAAATACATCLQQLLPALQSGAGMLAAFAAVNRATAEELGQTEATKLVSSRDRRLAYGDGGKSGCSGHF
jgi:hypothetical protein